MIKNYWKTARRHLLKNRFYSLINITGLALGMAACLFIFQYVHFELSYDQFHQHASEIYRVPFDWGDTDDQGNKNNIYASNVPAFGPAAQAEILEVTDYTRLFHVLAFTHACVLNYERADGQTVRFQEEKGFFADSSFFSMFSFPLLYGNPANALAAPNSMVLTTTLAEKYFGKNWENDAPLGKIIYVTGPRHGSYTVTGIMADMPENSHLPLDFLLSFASLGNGGAANSWVWSQCYTYLQLAPQAEPAVVEGKIADLIDKYYADLSDHPEIFLQPLTSIHLDSELRYEAGVNGSRTTVYFLSIIGVFILIIGWINYLNLTLAKSADRSKEVGVRKVMGTSRKHLLAQFILESLLINLLSALLALGLVIALQPVITSYLGWRMPEAGFFSLLQSPVYGIPYPFVWLFLAGSILSALYPAFATANATSTATQKLSQRFPRQGIAFRKILVISQFTASAVLIFGSLIVSRQLSYMQQKDLGMNIDQVLVLKSSSQSDSSYRAGLTYFKNQTQTLSSIEEVATTTFIPGREITYNRGVRRYDGEIQRGSNFFVVHTDQHFASTLKLELVAGRNFSEDFTTDATEAAILNEAAIHMLGYDTPEQALHQKIRILERGDPVLEIVGVLKNYHQKSLQQAHESIVLRYDPVSVGYLALRIKPEGDMHHMMQQAQDTWKEAFPSSPFTYFFLDDFFNQQYLAERQFNKVFSAFTGLAILIASFGLFGLASYTAVQRTKEIGIRKVLGASVSSILILLSQEYIKLTMIAFVIAMPVANYFFTGWLDHFVHRTSVPWWIFAMPGLLVLLIALLSVGGHTVKAARQNPVDSLRYE
uniref:ABC transporter permease n=1 Tax=Roseihalotalea indica TaxID=2867963 RepID=A0AA49GPE8_9BACT|nr:ABC transporter permease [Tunicatimonas sp. TK19036]